MIFGCSNKQTSRPTQAVRLGLMATKGLVGQALGARPYKLQILHHAHL
ncbi:MAG: hypothetical protein NZT92_00095 [Abditibacteriales bacterium]|nr:hypothetical protein [Abditibacteriales bacterium]